ncbi:preprotein translocase subunit SecG [Patescibacteria group bacterium]
MGLFILTIQTISALVLTGLVLIQTKGTGLGRAWGGGGGSSVSFRRRGLEKLIFRSTFVISFIFITASIVQVLI